MVQLDLDRTPTLSFAQLVLQFGGARCPDREAFWYCSQLSTTALKWWNMLTSDAQYGTALVMVHKYVEQHATWAMQFVCFFVFVFSVHAVHVLQLQISLCCTEGGSNNKQNFFTLKWNRVLKTFEVASLLSNANFTAHSKASLPSSYTLSPFWRPAQRCVNIGFVLFDFIATEM